MMTVSLLSSSLTASGEHLRTGLVNALPRKIDVVLLAVYALGFMAAHALAALWGGTGFYSLWFPAAGLRLALLWYAGARLTPAVALTELGVDLVTGAVTLATPDWSFALMGAVRPAFAYGVVVAMVKHWTSGTRAEIFTPPMPMALAMVSAPPTAALSALPQAWWRPDLTNVTGLHEIVLSLSAFMIGDMLGVLLVAPPVLWIAGIVASGRTPPLSAPSASGLVETGLVLGAGIGSGGVLAWLGLGLQPAPALMAVAWIGLRFGRAAAWGGLLLVSVLVLEFTVGEMNTAMRLQLHLGLTTVVMVGYLAGSFADARAQARMDLERRDRLLFQAERLKTLRAMSVAVIHEISQPLSTLAIEARHLHELTVSADTDIAATAALIDRKAGHLSELVRRLRRYGGRTVDEPSALPMIALIESVVALARPEANAAGVGLAIAPVDPDFVVMAQEVELAQAVVNLVRNAVQASDAGGEVLLTVSRTELLTAVSISNRVHSLGGNHRGMGIGTLVSRAIVEAHGGTLSRTVDDQGLVHAVISLPLIGEPG